MYVILDRTCNPRPTNGVPPASCNSNLDPNDAVVWCSLGALYQQHHQYKDAIGMYTRALTLRPHLPEAWFDVGLLYESCNQHQDANKAYEQARETGLVEKITQATLTGAFSAATLQRMQPPASGGVGIV